jgi:hypothetical protein
VFQNLSDDLSQGEVRQPCRRIDRFPTFSTVGVTDQSRHRQEDRENLKFESLSPKEDPNRQQAALRREFVFVQHSRAILLRCVA